MHFFSFLKELCTLTKKKKKINPSKSLKDLIRCFAILKCENEATGHAKLNVFIVFVVVVIVLYWYDFTVWLPPDKNNL